MRSRRLRMDIGYVGSFDLRNCLTFGSYNQSKSSIDSFYTDYDIFRGDTHLGPTFRELHL